MNMRNVINGGMSMNQINNEQNKLKLFVLSLQIVLGAVWWVTAKHSFRMLLLLLIFLFGLDILSGLRTGIVYSPFGNQIKKQDNQFYYWVWFIVLCVAFFLCACLFFMKIG